MKVPAFVIWPILTMCVIYGTRAELNLDVLEMQNQIPAGFLENVNYNQAAENKCIEISGEEMGKKAYSDVEAGFVTLVKSISELINQTTIQKEIQDAIPQGELDAVFNKYCAKRATALDHFETFLVTLKPCLDENEQRILDMLKHVLKSLLDFVCHKGGDQIALFIAEEGVECLESQKENINQCINSTFSSYASLLDVNGSNKSENKIPKLVVEEKQCDDMDTLKDCVVRHLEHCSKITPANLIEAMFNFIRNETVCRNYHHSALTAGGSMLGDNTHGEVFVLFTVMIFALCQIFCLK